MYISSILMLMIWPLVIILCWFAVKVALKLFEKNQEKMSQKH